MPPCCLYVREFPFEDLGTNLVACLKRPMRTDATSHNVGQQCCVRVYGLKNSTGFKLYATNANKCQLVVVPRKRTQNVGPNNVASVCMGCNKIIYFSFKSYHKMLQCASSYLQKLLNKTHSIMKKILKIRIQEIYRQKRFLLDRTLFLRKNVGDKY